MTKIEHVNRKDLERGHPSYIMGPETLVDIIGIYSPLTLVSNEMWLHLEYISRIRPPRRDVNPLNVNDAVICSVTEAMAFAASLSDTWSLRGCYWDSADKHKRHIYWGNVNKIDPRNIRCNFGSWGYRLPTKREWEVLRDMIDLSPANGTPWVWGLNTLNGGTEERPVVLVRPDRPIRPKKVY